MGENLAESFFSFSTLDNLTDGDKALDVFLNKVFANERIKISSAFYASKLGQIKNVAEQSICLVAAMDGEIIGMICYHPISIFDFNNWFDNKLVARISNLLVLPSYREIGTASALIETSVRFTKFLTKQFLSIVVNETEVEFISFLDHFGFKLGGTLGSDLIFTMSLGSSKTYKTIPVSLNTELI